MSSPFALRSGSTRVRPTSTPDLGDEDWSRGPLPCDPEVLGSGPLPLLIARYAANPSKADAAQSHRDWCRHPWQRRQVRLASSRRYRSWDPQGIRGPAPLRWFPGVRRLGLMPPKPSREPGIAFQDPQTHFAHCFAIETYEHLFESYSTQTPLSEIMSSRYEHVDTNEVAAHQTHLTPSQQQQLAKVLRKFQKLLLSKNRLHK